MDESGIHQWNETDYLARYPLAYYEKRQGLLYVLEDAPDGGILGAVVLLPEDERWDGQPDRRAWYVHNLVTKIGCPGAGKTVLRAAETLAKAQRMEAMRLDCIEGNEPLNRWYEAQGYLPRGACTDGSYHGVLRAKPL